MSESALYRAPAVAPQEYTPEGSPEAQRVGMIALIHTDESQLKMFASGAVGHTASQIHIMGDNGDRTPGSTSVYLPREPGNILLIPRHCLMDTRIEVTKYSGSIPLDGRNLVLALMQFIKQRDLNGVRYDACVSFFRNEIEHVDEVTYALPGPGSELVRLRVPLPE